MITVDPDILLRVEHILALLHAIADADSDQPGSAGAAAAAFVDLCSELGEKAAGTLIAHLPPEVLNALSAVAEPASELAVAASSCRGNVARLVMPELVRA